jgi:hypothetical protein
MGQRNHHRKKPYPNEEGGGVVKIREYLNWVSIAVQRQVEPEVEKSVAAREW